WSSDVCSSDLIGRHEWPVQLGPTTSAMLDGVRRILDTTEQDPVALIERTGLAAGFLRGTVRTTSHPTLLEAGYKHNVIPDRAEALVDVRPFAGQEEAVLAELRELAGPVVEVEVERLDACVETAFAGALAERMVAGLARHDREAEVPPCLHPGGTDHKALSQLDIAGDGFAPLRLGPELDFPAMFHGVDERVALDA